jgi:RNA polymerase sigma factor (sigma-70 family)
MRGIKNHHLEQLLMQLKFVSARKRIEYLKATEQLFHSIDPQKQYPFDFVCFRITGYHPKDLPEELIDGDILAEDLQIFVWKLSGKVAERAAEQNEKVYTIDELSEVLKVTTKTIGRWRQKGMLARKFVFGDGRKQLAVTESELQRFLKEHPDLAERAKDFERLSEDEKQQVIEKAKALAKSGGFSRRQVIRKVAQEMGRGDETVRQLLLGYDQRHKRGKIFKSVPERLKQSDINEIYRLYQQGVDIKELCKQFNRCRAAVYRVINQKREKLLLGRKIEFVGSDEFLKKGAFDAILAGMLQKRRRKSTAKDKLPLVGGALTKYLQSLKSVERLTRDYEAELFRKYNYLKYLVSTERADIKHAYISGRKLSRIERYLDEAERIKKIVIESNLPLVVSIASKHTSTGASLQELISEGNVALMRAVEKFDYSKGFRFATYASWVITRDFARKVPAEGARPDKSTAASFEDVQRNLRLTEAVDFGALERARSSLVHVIKNELNEREQYVILHHYGLTGGPVIKHSKTLQQIGDDLGLARERVRQIELTALQKLKQSLSIEEFELLTG